MKHFIENFVENTIKICIVMDSPTFLCMQISQTVYNSYQFIFDIIEMLIMLYCQKMLGKHFG